MNDILKKLIAGTEITDAEIANELYEICDRIHSSCNSECPIYAVNDSTPLTIDHACPCHKDGHAMLAFLRDKPRMVFWNCPNGCRDFVDWKHDGRVSVATCRKCGRKSKEIVMPLTPEEYVAKRGMCCPFCQSDQIQGESIDFESSGVYQNIVCLSCKKEWTDVYKLASYEALRLGDADEHGADK